MLLLCKEHPIYLLDMLGMMIFKTIISVHKSWLHSQFSGIAPLFRPSKRKKASKPLIQHCLEAFCEV